MNDLEGLTYLLSAEEASTRSDKTIVRHTNERGKTLPKAWGKKTYMLGMHPPKHETTYLYNNNCNFYSAFFMLNMIKCAIQSSLPKKGKLPLGTSLHITHSQSLTRQQQQQQQQ